MREVMWKRWLETVAVTGMDRTVLDYNLKTECND